VVETINNLWVLIAALLVFTMTISVGFLEVGELGEELDFSLLKTILMTGLALVVMAVVGFNTAFAPTGGVDRPPVLLSRLLPRRLLDEHALGDQWRLVVDAPRLLQHGLTTATYFLFETAFAAVTLALVGLVVCARSSSPPSSPTRSFTHPDLEPARGLDLEPDRLARPPRHGRLRRWAGRARRCRRSRARDPLPDLARGATTGPADKPQVPFKLSPGWLTLSILLLWVGCSASTQAASSPSTTRRWSS